MSRVELSEVSSQPSDAASVAREEETMSAVPPDLGARILELSVSALFGLWQQSIAWHGQRALEALTPDDER